ncbi:interferon-induced GTP-binding protein Mx [Obelidium mucronatum]|nr:interferon-induced GTP-binding protein Mx [Obelidium mucronatum]
MLSNTPKRKRDESKEATGFFDSNCFNAQRGLIDRLRSLGLDKYVELPQIATMGDTSSGKSSVLSAISGIQFPSNSELTTRCPTQLALDINYAPAFHGTVHEIEHEILRLTKKLVEEGQVISDDIISIEVYGPTYPDLTLLDLPGLVRTVADGESKSIIKRVRDLVDRHLKQERTIILAVVPANVDIHNTEILQAAEEADVDGLRTISIITKPDLIDPGAEKAVIDLLMNRKKELKLGYHAVRCRGQKDLNEGVSISDGIELEKEFFTQKDAWKDVDPEYWGISNLTEKLVRHLEHLIAKTLSSVISEINSHLHNCKTELNQLGEALSSNAERRAFYSNYVEKVCVLMHATDAIDNRARALLRKEDDKFREIIGKTKAPDFKSRKEDSKVGDYVEVHANNPDTLKKRWIIKQVTAFAEKGGVSAADNADWRPLTVTDLTALKQQISDNRGDEIAVFPSYNLFQSLVCDYVQTWESPTLKLLEQYETILSATFNRALEQNLPPKYDRVRLRTAATVSKVMEAAKKTTMQVLQDALYNERRPYTQNSNLYETLAKLRAEPLIDALEKLCTPKGRLIHIDAVIAIMKSFGAGTASNEDREATELQIAVKAYLEVAKTRFIDMVPMKLEQHFVRAVVQEIKNQLSLVSDDVLEAVLQEAPAVVRRRHDLTLKLRSLVQSKEEIQNL